MCSRESAHIAPKGGVKVPPGGIVINEKWLGTPLGSAFQNASSSVFFYDNLGLIDFFISEELPVVYFPQSELIDSNLYQTKLLRLLGTYPKNLTVITERNEETIDLYNSLQEYVIVDLDSNVKLIPVAIQSELPSFLLSWAKRMEGPSSNLFHHKTKSDLGLIQIGMISVIPGVGEKKAKLLLEKFGNLRQIANASEASLSTVVSDKAAKSIRSFFNS